MIKYDACFFGQCDQIDYLILGYLALPSVIMKSMFTPRCKASLVKIADLKSGTLNLK